MQTSSKSIHTKEKKNCDIYISFHQTLKYQHSKTSTMCGTASGWAKLSLLCLFIGTILHIAGWSSNSWMTNAFSDLDPKEEVDVGLWRQKKCDIQGNCETKSVEELYQNSIGKGNQETRENLVIVFSIELI